MSTSSAIDRVMDSKQPAPKKTASRAKRNLPWRTEAPSIGNPTRVSEPAIAVQQLRDTGSQAKQWWQSFWELYRSRIVILAVLAVAAVLAVSWLGGNLGSKPSPVDPAQVIPIQPVVTTEAPAPEIMVHVVGAVVAPGVYSLPLGARVDQLIAQAGGATPAANLDGINRAQRLADGGMVCIPDQSESGGCAAICCAGGVGGTGAGSPAQLLINPNTATPAELEQLPGIGPALAAVIEEYRQQGGRFRTPQDLLEVSGIGPETLKRFEAYLVF